MATSSEDVLLLVNNVRYQKKEGTLYVMGERLAWIMEGKDVFSASHKYADIKTQKISPDGKAKVQLQVVLHDGGASTFHFTNPLGNEAQLRDRNDVKEYLQQLLPRFKRKVNKELEEKNRLLSENPDLLQLYRDLVTSQVITAEQFWADHAVQRQNTGKMTQTQDIGVSGAFLAEVKPQTDGCNGLKYNLNADIIYSIFKTYPAVKKKHIEYVPEKMSESEFWTKFFQSHYFHRDRINSGNKDVFAECAKSDEQDVQQELSKASGDPLLDITSYTDSSLDQGYGLGARDGPSTNNIANRNLIKRFNHHSMMVLKAGETSRKATEAPVSAPNSSESAMNGRLTNGDAGLLSNGAVEKEGCEEPISKKAKLKEKTKLEDLEENHSQQGVRLRLQRTERYFHGPTPALSSDSISSTELQETTEKVQSEISFWNQDLTQVLSSNTSVSVLKELSPGGLLMKSSNLDEIDQLTTDVRTELHNLYGALCELLRHFWSCFPITSKTHLDKVTRMRTTLERFQYAKLKPFQDKLLRDHFNTNLTHHMTDMLQAAYAKFDNWQTKRVGLKL